MDHAGLREARALKVDGDPEIRQVGVRTALACGVQEDVCRFNVAMHQVRGVDRLEAGQELAHDLGGKPGR